ncbi:general odorant-binding protein 56a [Drosophila guanche]|uniref:Blast:General odorant-binding protein 56a n=1 Tax=Drosophila guanche TaxID=7266 RepID=A0A3B0JJG9_DROGU|nr:general odorant-binding protein 56a [Drosophila guanche]SPP75490.1 blast:General odorant-binding protein 56a [Drosophila guanche]
MNSYFVIALSAVLVALALSSPVELNEDQKALAKQHGEQCSKELNLTEEEVAKVKAKDFKNPTENIKCFANCFFEKVGTLKDGELQEEVVLEKLGSFIGEEKTKAALEKCRSIKGDNKCETAVKLHACFEEFKPDIKA